MSNAQATWSRIQTMLTFMAAENKRRLSLGQDPIHLPGGFGKAVNHYVKIFEDLEADA